MATGSLGADFLQPSVLAEPTCPEAWSAGPPWAGPPYHRGTWQGLMEWDQDPTWVPAEGAMPLGAAVSGTVGPAAFGYVRDLADFVYCAAQRRATPTHFDTV